MVTTAQNLPVGWTSLPRDGNRHSGEGPATTAEPIASVRSCRVGYLTGGRPSRSPLNGLRARTVCGAGAR